MSIALRNTDVYTTISIAKPNQVLTLGNPLIIVAGDAESFKQYYLLGDLQEDFDESTSVFAKADALFAQVNAPRLVNVLTYVKSEATPKDVSAQGGGSGVTVTTSGSPDSAIVQAVLDHFWDNWNFALLADYNEQDALGLAKLFFDNQEHFLFVQVPDVASLKALEDYATTAKTNSKFSMTKAFVHNVKGEQLDAAVVGFGGNLTVGSLDWAHCYDLVGITADTLTPSEVKAIENAGGTAYITKGSHAVTSNGKAMDGSYIDQTHGIQWIQTQMQSRIQDLITESGKLPFNNSGIALLKTCATGVLSDAFGQGIIDTDDETGKGVYTVTALERVDLDPQDIADRAYRGLSWTAKLTGAIDTVYIHGTITE